MVPFLVSYAVGVLLGAAFLDLLPEAAESLPLIHVCATVLAGILAFFMREKFALWHHAHPTADGASPWQAIQPPSETDFAIGKRCKYLINKTLRWYDGVAMATTIFHRLSSLVTRASAACEMASPRKGASPWD